MLRGVVAPQCPSLAPPLAQLPSKARVHLASTYHDGTPTLERATIVSWAGWACGWLVGSSRSWRPGSANFASGRAAGCWHREARLPLCQSARSGGGSAVAAGLSGRGGHLEWLADPSFPNPSRGHAVTPACGDPIGGAGSACELGAEFAD